MMLDVKYELYSSVLHQQNPRYLGSVVYNITLPWRCSKSDDYCFFGWM